MPEPGSKRVVLITGAGGTIGRSLTERLGAEYALRLHERVARDADDGHEHVGADIRDFDQVRALMSGVDTVVHLAGDPNVPASWESVRDNNITGTYNVLEAARQAGVRRVVFASTNHVMGMYDRDRQWPVYNHLPVRPDSYYGVSKAFGETLARFYFDAWGLSTICLRIGWFRDEPSDDEVGGAMWLSPRDCAQLVRLAIEAPVATVPFGIFYAISGNGDRKWDLTDTMLQLGYRPDDDRERRNDPGADNRHA